MSPIRPLAGRAVLALAFTLGMVLSHPVPSWAAGTTITILESFDPDSVTVAPGTTITWVNESADRHRVRTTSGPAAFDSGNLEPGAQFSVTLSTVGTYAYRDDRDPDNSAFWAEIVVATAAATATPPPPGATAAPTMPPASGDVGMAGRVFRPSMITIAPGGSVTWRNDDGRDHTVTATNGAFDSGTLAPGRTFVRTFPRAGTFPYLCVIHPDMTGTVVVTAPGTTPPPAPAPTPTPKPTPVTTPAPGSIRAVDYAFQPTSLTVAAGTRVTFVNAGRAPHTMTARDGSFDSGTVAAGGRWARTFGTAGTFPFLCVIHPDMVGTIRVTDASGVAPPPTVTPAPSAPAGAPAAPGALSILDFRFEPDTVRVAAGTALTWVNDGVAPHTVTDRGGTFDSGFVAAGGSWTHAFPDPGTYAFWCVIHPEMTGAIEVTPAGPGPSANAPPPGPDASGGPPDAQATATAQAAAGVAGVGGGGGASGAASDGDPGLTLPAAVTDPADYLRIALAFLLTGAGVVLFLRTITGAVRQPDRE